KVWPRSIECQGMTDNMGDIWNIDEFPMTVDLDRTEGRRTAKLHDSNERPLGEWNEYEITLGGGELEIAVNGLVQNEASDCWETPGKIGLQSEGARMEYRNIVVVPIEKGEAIEKKEGVEKKETARAEPFEVDLTAPPGAPFQSPWKVVPLPDGWAGQYIVAADLDGDGTVEFVTGRNADQVMTTVVAIRLDGSILWRWGGEGEGTFTRFFDVPLQIYDHDGDGAPEVFAGIAGEILVFAGKDGTIRRRLRLPEGLRVADCIAFARLTSRRRATDIIIKDRYEKIWAYDADWRLLWAIERPGGYRTCHHPMPLDIDGDGYDEVMGGYSLIDRAGKVLWTVRSERIDLARGHLDCARLVRRGADPAAARIALSYCGSNGVALVDGAGKTLWEIPGAHFESIDVGDVRSDIAGLEVVVDVDHRPFGDGPLWIIAESGEVIGRYKTNYARYHHLVDWDGDGEEDIVLPNALRIVDGRGRIIARLGVPDAVRADLLGDPGERSNEAPFLLMGSFSGEGKREVLINSHRAALIYRNPSARIPDPKLPLGSEPNFTLY
ncbi:MAG: DUF1080 domain-containing protein, partial [Planctomycetes bacterium]|nr:DUF1080 domain-containing protein [Planctomycetota bacterium]